MRLFNQAEVYFIQLQKQLSAVLQQLEQETETTDRGSGKVQKFVSDKWQSSLGQGCSNILQNGTVLEKAGVNFSSIASTSLPLAASSRNPHLAGKPYKACGISVVVHPYNPYVPASHANLRIFTLNPQTAKQKSKRLSKQSNEQSKKVKDWWFGGGIDLTPYYIQEEDCILWHKKIKAVCDKFEKGLYGELKKNCDDYFYLPHRQETRGVGGIFFDDFNRWDEETHLNFMKEVGECYLDTYTNIIKNNMYVPFGKKQRNFQLQRRGRYVEFNLLYDRGTLFGLQSGGRTESILMSLPPLARWDYSYNLAVKSEEGKLKKLLQKRDWLKEY